jgi:pimeloyl-ACP methyl ester carboxylesterase
VIKLVFGVSVFCLSACTIHLTPQNFIHQDETVGSLDLQGLQEGQEKALPLASSISASSSITSAAASPGILRPLKITGADDKSLVGLALMQSSAEANIIFFAGNGMTLNQSAEVLARLSKIPANVIWFDYRGVGVSDSSNSVGIDLFRNDSFDIYNLAKEIFPPQLPLIVHGVSMGSLIAAELAGSRPVDGLVLDSAMASVAGLSERLTPMWAKLFATVVLSDDLISLNNSESFKKYSGPLLILVGSEDRMTPIADAKLNLSASPSHQKTLVVIDGAAHVEPLMFESTLQAYTQFLKDLDNTAPDD